MSNSQLLDASFSGGLKMPHYVNGRLLSADDLKADQEATLARLRWLGMAAGYGVIEGLMVSGETGSRSVRVTAGWGVNREGHVIRLPGDVTLALAPEAGSAARADDAGLFADCTFDESGGGPGGAVNGAYLLTVLPASQQEGQAPLKASAGSTLSPGCAAKWDVEGVQFKVIRLSGFSAAGSTDKNRQNLLAHWCLGSEGLRRLPPDPFDFDEDYTGLDEVAAADLTTCDLPLGVFHWQGGKLTFVDAWSARRRPVRPFALETWRGVLSDKRMAVGYARFLQFQAQAEKMSATAAAGSVRAKDYFRYLPPVGFIPIRPPELLLGILIRYLRAGLATGQREVVWFNKKVDAPSKHMASLIRADLPQSGFDLQTFFGDALPDHIGLMPAESVEWYVQRSWHDEAIDLTRPLSFDVLIVKEVWLRLIAGQLAGILQAQAKLSDLTAAETKTLVETLNAVKATQVGGVEDRPYALFVKRVDPIVYVPVSKKEAPDEGISGKITIWYPYEVQSAADKVFKESLDHARKANPNATIEVEAMPPEPQEIDEKLKAAIMAGRSPDLVLWKSSSARQWARDNILLPLDKIVTRVQAVPDLAYEALSQDGALYGVPLSFELVAGFLNQEAGMQAPRTTEELVEFAVKNKGRVALVQNPYHAYGFFTGFGGKLMYANGHCRAAKGGFEQALDYMLELQRVGTQFLSPEDAIGGFAGHDILLTFGGPWYLDKARQALGDQLQVFPIPAGVAKNQPVAARPLLDVMGFLVPSGSDNAENAARLALELAGGDAQAEYADQAYQVPVRTDVKPKDEAVAAFARAALNAEPYPQHERFQYWWTPFQTALDDVLDKHMNVLDALQRACDEMDKAG